MRPDNRASREAAETMALQALAHVISDAGLRERFLRLTGLSPDDVRARAADPGFGGGVLDFLLGDERTLNAFCAQAGIDPALPARLRRLLPGATPEG